MEKVSLKGSVPQSCWINDLRSIEAGCARDRGAAFAGTLIGNRVVDPGTDFVMGQFIEEIIDYSLQYGHFRKFLYKLCHSGVVNGASDPHLPHIFGQSMEGHAMSEGDYVTTSQRR